MDDLRIAQWLDAKITEDDTRIQDLAKHVGVSVSQVSKWKSGDQALRRPEHVFKIASYYSVDPMRLLATADPAFREQGIEPLPIPEVGHGHLLSRLPRYVGERERALMGRIARLGAAAKDHEASDPTERVEYYFTAIDNMLDNIQAMLDGGKVSDEQQGRVDGASGPGKVRQAGQGSPEPDGAGDRPGGVGRKWSRRIAAPHLPSLPGSLAFGW